MNSVSTPRLALVTGGTSGIGAAIAIEIQDPLDPDGVTRIQPRDVDGNIGSAIGCNRAIR